MVLRLGAGNNTKAIGPTNQALSKIAQVRVDSTVARAVARHEAALKVDGSEIYLWTRGNGGLICTCRQPAKSFTATAIDVEQTDSLRQPLQDIGIMPDISSRPGADFKIIHNRAQLALDSPQIVPDDFAGINDDEDNSLDSLPEDEFDSLSTLNTAQTDAQIAFMLNNGAAINGGDKTACGICFGTGRTHGYELATGRRMVLDASNEFPFTCYNGASIQPSTYPAQFSISPGQWVEWLVDLPSYTNGWLSFTIRNNLVSATNLKIEWFQRNQWQSLSLIGITATEGSDRRQTRFRVKSSDVEDFAINLFTHVELIYSTTKPLLGQCPPLNLATNYESLEPLITTEFEILANIQDIPRESVFQDSKFKYLWKVLDITPKMTARGQIYSYTLNARMVHRSEPLYALRVIFDPQINVHYRGLEIIEGGLESDEPDYIKPQNNLTFKLSTGA